MEIRCSDLSLEHIIEHRSFHDRAKCLFSNIDFQGASISALSLTAAAIYHSILISTTHFYLYESGVTSASA